jgi:hypothetical protein
MPRWFALLASGLVAAASAAVAQEFRIETDVYLGDEPEVVSHTVTLFEKAAVYEFVDDQPRIVVYRRGDGDRPGVFVLLDPKAQKRTEVQVTRIESLMKKLNAWAGEQKDPILKFAAAPKFTENFDAETGDLTLESQEWTYRVATVPAENKQALARYQDFTDRFAELSTMLYGSAPPAPRQALDAALARRHVIPVEIRRITAGDEKNEVRAAHLFSWRLSREDRRRLDEAQKYLASFEKVANEKFLEARRESVREAKRVMRGQSQ